MTPHFLDFLDAVGTVATVIMDICLLIAMYLFRPRAHGDRIIPVFHLLLWLFIAFAYITLMDMLAWAELIDTLTYSTLRRAGGRLGFAVSMSGFLITIFWKHRHNGGNGKGLHDG